MTSILLPIAQVEINIIIILIAGLGVGFLSGLFGVGGGFLMTPLLIFLGIPPATAVGTEANQILGSSVSGGIAHGRKGNIDYDWSYVMHSIEILIETDSNFYFIETKKSIYSLQG